MLNPRIGLLAGSLVAVVYNLGSSNSAIGGPAYLTMVDGVHFTALAIVLLATVTAVVAGIRVEHGVAPDRIRRFDYQVFWAGVLSFAAANVALIAFSVR